MKNILAVLIISVLLISCSWSEPIGKYQAIEANGNLIIVNTTDGSGDVYSFLEVKKYYDGRPGPGRDSVNNIYFTYEYRLIGRLNNDQIPLKNDGKNERSRRRVAPPSGSEVD
jgi:hypothetical protein